MSEEQLKAFLQKVKADISLQEKLKAAADAEAVAAIAKEAGFSISADGLKRTQSKLSEGELAELSEGELEGVAGGCGSGGNSLLTAEAAARVHAALTPRTAWVNPRAD